MSDFPRNPLWILFSISFFCGCLGTGNEDDSYPKYQPLGTTYRDFAPLAVGNIWKYAVIDSGHMASDPYRDGFCFYVRTLRLDSMSEEKGALRFSILVHDSGIARMTKYGCLCADSIPCGCEDTVDRDTSYRLSGTTSADTPSIIMQSLLFSYGIDFAKYKTFDKNVIWMKTDAGMRYDSLVLSQGSAFVKSYEAATGYKFAKLSTTLYRQDVGLSSFYREDCLIGLCTKTTFELIGFLPRISP